MLIPIQKRGVSNNLQVIHSLFDTPSLGYGHPNSLHLSLFILISLYIYVKYSSLKIYNLIFWMIVNLFIFNYSGSRTGALSVFFVD